MATPSEKVLALPELLENILHYLDVKQLFVIQRVNSTFKSTISTTKSLRRIIFLEPYDGPTHPHPAPGHDWDGPCMDEETEARLDNMLNPLLRKDVVMKIPLATLEVVDLMRGEMGDTEYEIICDTLPDPTDAADTVDTTGSWRSMFLTRKGWKAFFRVFCIDTYYQPDEGSFKFYSDTQLGEVMDSIARIHAHFHAGDLEIRADQHFGGLPAWYIKDGVTVASWYDLSVAGFRLVDE